MPVIAPYFEGFPKILRAGLRQTIQIRSLFEHSRFTEDAACRVAIFPFEGAGFEQQEPPVQMDVQAQQGVLRITYDFPGEQEYVILVTPPDDSEKTQPLEFRVYAVQEDLFERRPFKGDFHMHSNCSDGKEPPAYVAAACRQIGMDFMAITDHRRYAPSLEAMHAWEKLPIDLRIFPGEEVHPPQNHVHMINFGGRFSINELFDSEAYPLEVERIERGLDDLPEGKLRYQYASCLWVYEKIRQVGGLGIFCHPYWIWNHQFNVPETLIERHLRELPFDAYEVIGGFHLYERESNLLQVARYHEARSRGLRVPIVGSSDSHGCNTSDLFGWYYTILFARSVELDEIIAGVKDCWAVAVDAWPGETLRVHGPFRLVKYAHFLQREVLPQHDELCREEGRLMLAYLSGDEHALEGLYRSQGQVQALFDRLWATGE
jgi:hypothetical protein